MCRRRPGGFPDVGRRCRRWCVYWAVKASPGAADGKIRGCKLPGCPGGPETLAEGQADPVALALDGEFVYWANKGTGSANTGSIVRVRR